MIPFARNPHFVGRQEEIQKIEDSITVPDGPRKLAITGLGGVGKTQIALEVAYRMRDRHPECSIFWIPCTSYEAIEQGFMTIAQILGLQEVEPAEVKECLRTYFNQSNKKWILVFDNADEMDIWTRGSPTAPPLKNMIPRNENGRVIFTSRNCQLALKLAAVNVVSVPDVDQKTGKEILRKLLMRKDLLEDDYVTNALLEKLSYLPLAISQAAAYINQNYISLATYMSLLGEQGASIELLSEEFEDDGRYTATQNPVATTWLISFAQIKQLDEIASDYLSFMACISPREIPDTILPPTVSAKRKVEALGLLKAYSFVSAQVDDSILSLHRLVHLATRNWLRKHRTFARWVETTTQRLDKIFPDYSHSNRRTWREYLPHALYLADSAEFQAHHHDYDDFLTRIGGCLESDGRYAKAETLFRNVLQIRERACGLEDARTLTSVSQLGSVLTQQGKYEEAEAMHRRALQVREKVLGPEHPDTLTSIAGLGTVLFDQGRLVKAEKLEVQVLGSRKRMLGPEHPETLTSMHNLALTWKGLGMAPNAFSLLRECVDLRNKVLGADHPQAALSFNTLLSWETNSEPASADAPTPPRVHTYASDHITLKPNPAGRNRRDLMDFLFRRR